jgi:hypothetical protein
MKTKILLCVCTLAIGVFVACGKSAAPASPSGAAGAEGNLGPDGATLKIGAPPLSSPANGFQFARNAPIQVTITNVQGTYATFPVTYELELRNSAGTSVITTMKQPAGSGPTTTFTITTSLTADTVFSYRARATKDNLFGPWSATGTFRTPIAVGIFGSTVIDPLTEGFTVGKQKGGHFIQGVGWQATTVNDGIDYDITTCPSCRIEFDLTNVSEGEGVCCNADMKFLSMGDGAAFNSFQDFRDHPWKMHLVQRGDGDGTGLEIIFRNGGTDPEDNPGDHRIKMTCCGPDFRDSSVFHFVIDYSPAGYNISVGTNGGPQVTYLVDGFGGIPYAPPNHRISLGCYPRSETIPGAIYRNVTVTPR